MSNPLNLFHISRYGTDTPYCFSTYETDTGYGARIKQIKSVYAWKDRSFFEEPSYGGTKIKKPHNIQFYSYGQIFTNHLIGIRGFKSNVI